MTLSARLVACGIVGCTWICEPVLAEDGPECFSKYTRTNVCEFARRAQADLAASLPMRISSNVTLATALVAGPRVIITAMFDMTKASAEDLAAQNHITMTQWASKLDVTTKNTVCSHPKLGAFVRLGGQIQYQYKALDGFILFDPTITAC